MHRKFDLARVPDSVTTRVTCSLQFLFSLDFNFWKREGLGEFPYLVLECTFFPFDPTRAASNTRRVHPEKMRCPFE